MQRKAFFVTLALAILVGVAGAQIPGLEPEDPFAVQEQPVYLKSLTSGREKKLESREDIEEDFLLDRAINGVGRAFELGDPDVLESHLVAGKRRIYLALDIDEHRRGHYGPGQVRHIFGRRFRDIETRSFVYDSSEIERQNESAVVRADWTYVVLDTDEVVRERLQLKLEKGSSDWRVYEIRAASR